MWFSNFETIGRTSSYCERLLSLLLSNVNDMHDLMHFHCNVILQKVAFALKAHYIPLVMRTNLRLNAVRLIRRVSKCVTAFSTVHICVAVLYETNNLFLLVLFQCGFVSGVLPGSRIWCSSISQHKYGLWRERCDAWEWERWLCCPLPHQHDSLNLYSSLKMYKQK